MSWKCYSTIFKAESSVHIGYRQIGILKTTRYYITGRAMWGAITANLTRALFDNPGPEDYQYVGNFVRENIRTSYFYPAVKTSSENLSNYKANGYSVFLPEYTDEGLKFGNKSREWFEKTFVDSFVSTALSAESRTAEEGSLHEVEYIRDRVEINGGATDVYWAGYLLVDCGVEEGKEIKLKLLCEGRDVKVGLTNGSLYKEVSLKNVLSLIFAGGERNYGFGKLRLVDDFSEENNELFKAFPVNCKENVNGPVINTNSKKPAPAHVEFEGTLEEFVGEIEPLVGLEWSEKGAGHRISKPVVCVTPGSKFVWEKLMVGEYGILKQTSNKA
ncbi:MAG: hypothetical protein H5T93_02710 [Pseudothermotoga sp.]|uniref:hypothetical protein n=1 Tax=Pseudothermotoga sp. TaxID=2033661 RepID=UPI00074A70AD|nr:MAG: Conserved protein, putative [Desulfonauticus sp. 38_4375]MBC7115934.1 hypothetical protein [Pseudothermotoga sp.]HBT38890.1 hypothetical protein [Pseudothermotoga sp.]HCO97861.1 hypothetical protein [Pseudothermotoga sp.]